MCDATPVMVPRSPVTAAINAGQASRAMSAGSSLLTTIPASGMEPKCRAVSQVRDAAIVKIGFRDRALNRLGHCEQSSGGFG